MDQRSLGASAAHSRKDREDLSTNENNDLQQFTGLQIGDDEALLREEKRRLAVEMLKMNNASLLSSVNNSSDSPNRHRKGSAAGSGFQNDRLQEIRKFENSAGFVVGDRGMDNEERRKSSARRNRPDMKSDESSHGNIYGSGGTLLRPTASGAVDYGDGYAGAAPFSGRRSGGRGDREDGGLNMGVDEEQRREEQRRQAMRIQELNMQTVSRRAMSAGRSGRASGGRAVDKSEEVRKFEDATTGGLSMLGDDNAARNPHQRRAEHLKYADQLDAQIMMAQQQRGGGGHGRGGVEAVAYNSNRNMYEFKSKFEEEPPSQYSVANIGGSSNAVAAADLKLARQREYRQMLDRQQQLNAGSSSRMNGF
jgi:hypothetical protein